MNQIFIIDDHPIVRSGISNLLLSLPGHAICGEAATIPEARALLESITPDLILLDILLKEGSGLDFLKELRANKHPAKVVILSMMDEVVYAERALRAGADGFVMKEQAVTEVELAIKTALAGQTYLSAEVAQQIALRATHNSASQTRDRDLATLTDRELQVFELIGRGLTSKQIASDLSLATTTIQSHKQHIRNKLNCHTMAELNRSAAKFVEGSGR